MAKADASEFGSSDNRPTTTESATKDCLGRGWAPHARNTNILTMRVAHNPHQATAQSGLWWRERPFTKHQESWRSEPNPRNVGPRAILRNLRAERLCPAPQLTPVIYRSRCKHSNQEEVHLIAPDPCRVAVLLATYNGARYIGDLLESLVAQTRRDFTLIVRDDGSTDGTLGVVENYSSRLDIIVITSDVRLGPAQSFLALLHCAEGYDLFFFADQDDFWEPSKIERAEQRLSSDRDSVALYCSRLRYVDRELKPIGYSKIPRRIDFGNALVENIAAGCTVAITGSARRLVLDHLPPQPIMHDWWLYLAATAFGVVIYDCFPTIRYRQHGGNVLGAPTHVLQGFARRVRRFFRREGGAFCLSKQAAQFESCFTSRLTRDQADLLQLIRFGKTRFADRIRLACAPRLVRQTWLDTIMLKIVLLSGRF